MTRKRVGYAKIGRAMPLSQGSWGFVGGDDEPPLLLKDLALRNPDIDFVLIGRNSGEDPAKLGFPRNVINPWVELAPKLKARAKEVGASSGLNKDSKQRLIAVFDELTLPLFDDLDEIILWTGQHGTTNFPIPKSGSDWSDLTDPQESFIKYASYLVRGINYWRKNDPHNREEIHVIADARNYLKLRDLKWPNERPILGQFEFTRTTKHERFGDEKDPSEYGYDGPPSNSRKILPTVWSSEQTYIYSRLEICGIMPWHIDSTFSDDWDREHQFGLFINEARAYVKHNRADALKNYVLPMGDVVGWIHGTWSDASKEKLGLDIQPAPWEDYYPLLRRTRTTLTTPSSGSGWATTKPWQAFAVGTVCFFHPQYDTQNNILGDAPEGLAQWLRVSTPEELHQRVAYLNSPDGKPAWEWLVNAQRQHYDNAVRESRHLKLIEERIRA